LSVAHRIALRSIALASAFSLVRSATAQTPQPSAMVRERPSASTDEHPWALATAPVDSAHAAIRGYWFSPHRSDLTLAAGFALATAAAAFTDAETREEAIEPGLQRRSSYRQLFRVAGTAGDPGALVASTVLFVAGRASGKPAVAVPALRALESIIVSGVITGGGKVLVGRERPDAARGDAKVFRPGRGFSSSDFQSFPSGHATAAFAAAMAVDIEGARYWPRARPYVAPLLYGGATLVGVSRIYHDRHWSSDVVAGAAVGTITARLLTRGFDSHPGNAVDRFLLGGHIAPTMSGFAVHLGAR
jgi:membrane-associated phospholipid phosphatase